MLAGILIYLIVGLLFTYMYSRMIIWLVKRDGHRMNKTLLLVLSYVYFTLFYPIVIYRILKKDIENFDKKFK